MLYSTRGIVLKTIKYSESSIIAKIYTEHLGLRTYIVKGLSAKNSHRKKALLQGLSLLNMVVYEKPGAGLQNIKEIEIAHTYHSVPFDIAKSAIIMFLNEVLYKSIGEEVGGIQLFNFIFDELIALDLLEKNISVFHLRFLIRLSRHLGFLPRNNFSEKNQLFDLQEGAFISAIPLHSNYLDPGLSKKLSLFISDDMSNPAENQTERNELLEKIILFYSLHVPAFDELKSFNVLKQVFN
ncbi:MAG: DNA repair protein RecO [Bacteroidales bacterium]|nr:DNA repair protein RecO [Bacteroidales bacterium]